MTLTAQDVVRDAKTRIREIRPDHDALVLRLARTEPWSRRIVSGKVTVVDICPDRAPA